MSKELTLYFSPNSSCSRKVIFALIEKNIPYKEIIINLRDGEQKQPEFIKLNPHGKVPVMRYGNDIIYDSAIINEFINEEFKQQPLLPSDPILRAKVRLSTHYADNFFYPCISEILADYRKEINERNEKQIQEKIRFFQNKHLKWLENQLKNANPFLFGKLTLADIAYAPALDNLMDVSGLELDTTSTVRAWFQHISKLESFKKSCRN